MHSIALGGYKDLGKRLAM